LGVVVVSGEEGDPGAERGFAVGEVGVEEPVDGVIDGGVEGIEFFRQEGVLKGERLEGVGGEGGECCLDRWHELVLG